MMYVLAVVYGIILRLFLTNTKTFLQRKHNITNKHHYRCHRVTGCHQVKYIVYFLGGTYEKGHIIFFNIYKKGDNGESSR